MNLHHIGIVVSDIQKYEKKMIFEQKIHEVYDPIQNATLALYSNFGSSFIELIQPMNQDSFTFAFLQKNGDMFHHFCYQINISDLPDIVAEHKLLKLMDPVPALLFNNQRVAFYYSRNRQVVEFLLNE